MTIFSMISSWTFVIIIVSLITYEDKKKNINISSKKSYLYIASDAFLRIAVISVAMKLTMDFMLYLFNL